MKLKLIAIGILAMAFMSCDSNDSKAEEKMEDASEWVDDKADDVEDGMEEAGDEIEDATDGN